MNKAALLLGVAAVALLASGSAAASVQREPMGPWPDDAPADEGDEFTDLYDQLPTHPMDTQANIRAFCTAIAVGEGTEGQRDPYRVCYAYRHTIQSFADHPAVTGEWRGEPLDSLGPAYAGKVSTAAGRYQLIKPTWLEAKQALGLRDFSPASQDAAAVYLIRKRGALADVEQGRFAQAVQKVRREWASMPGSGWGQPERTFERLAQAYVAAGGTIA